MSFRPFEVSIPHIIYALLGAFIVLFGMFSLFLRERLYVGEAIWAFIFGVIIGPYCAGIFNPHSWASGNEETDNLITLEFTRIVLAIGVFAIGVELPKAYMKKHWKSLFFLIVPVMTWGWFVSAALIFALIPGLNFLSSLAVAACLTPTDPILAAAVVGGKWADKHVPAHIRHLLAAESACNDGAAFPFLYLALYLTIDNSIGKAIKDWFLSLWLYQVILGSVIGCLLGYSFRHLMKFCQRHDLIDRNSYVAQYVSLTMLTIGVTTLLGSDDLLAAFFCGTAFAWDGFFNKQTEESVFSSVMDTLFNVAAFIYVGAWMPFNKFQDAELTLSVWRLIVIAILVLLLRRLPITILLYKFIPDIKTFREAMFTGHFGPMGIGAVFISTLAVMVLENANSNADADASSHRAPTAQTILLERTIQPIVAFMVLCSIAVHGLSIPSFSLGRRMHSVSRTWSRRDTLGSTRTGPGGRLPEWANQARMVSRAEDVVVNRDPGADLERGDSVLEKEKQDEEKEQEQELGSSSGTTAAESVHTMEGVEEEMEGSGLSGETRVAGYAPAAPATNRARFVEGDVMMTPLSSEESPLSRYPLAPPPVSRVSSPEQAQQRPPSQEEKEEEGRQSQRLTDKEKQKEGEKKYGWVQYHLWPHEPLSIPQTDRDAPPDGPEQVREWMEGSQKVIERRIGPGDDVEVTVIHQQDPSLRTRWHGKAHELHQDAEEVGHAISRELDRLRARAREAMTGERSTSTELLGHSSGSRRGSRTSLGLFKSPSRPGKDEKGKEKEETKEEEKISVLFSRAKQAELEERKRQQQQHDRDEQKRLAEHVDSAVDDEDEEDEEGWASDPDFNDRSLPAPSGSGGPLALPVKLARSGSRSSRHSHTQQHTVHPSHPSRRRRGVSSRRGSMEPEQTRGRLGADELASSAPISTSIAIPGGPEAVVSSGSSPTQTSPGPTVSPPSQQSARPQRHPLPQTRPHTSSGLSSGGASRSSSAMFSSVSSRSGTAGSRPGTADSLRNNRVNTIRFAHEGGSRRGTPGPTRESSPARSVRFVDEAPPVGVGQDQGDRGDRGDNRIVTGLTSYGQVAPLAESPVEEGERDVKG